MSKIDELIQQYCPSGVEYKKIKNVYARLKGTPVTATKMKEIASEDGEIRIFAGGKTVINAHEKDIPNANITRIPAVLVQSRGVIDAVYYDKPFTFKNEMWAYTSQNKISVKFLYYVLKNNIQVFRDAASGMGSLPQISLKVTEEFSIPVPPLPVQEEIVRILDKFTQLEAELEAELEARRKQYEFYRDKLLSPTNEWKTMPLGEICTILRGKRLTKKELSTIEKFPVFHGGIEPIGYFSKCNRKAETTMVINVGASAGTIGYCKTDFWSSDGCFCLSKSNLVSSRFLFYRLQTCENEIKSKVRKAGIPTLDNRVLEKISIPVPPLAEQARIVSILDKFDALVNDLSAGLPTEIAARRQQYEYYRDQLLSFPVQKQAV